MSKMSNIDLTIQYINNWLKKHLAYIVAIIFVIIIAICVYGQADRDITRVREKENRITNIEMRLTKQENYMHEIIPSVKNLYEVIEK